MDKVSVSLAGLLDSLNPALQKIAEMFCISMDTLREHGMEYILMYGKYHLITYLTSVGWLMLFADIGVMIGLYFMIRHFIFERFYYGRDYSNNRSEALEQTLQVLKCIKLINKLSFIGTAFIVFWVLMTCIPYWISPEIYSIQAVMELVQSVQ